MLFQFAFLFVCTTKPRTSAQLRDAQIDDRQCALARDVSAITDHPQLRGHAYRWSFAIAMTISISALRRACWARHSHAYTAAWQNGARLRTCATTAIRSDDRTRHTLCTCMGSGRKWGRAATNRAPTNSLSFPSKVPRAHTSTERAYAIETRCMGRWNIRSEPWPIPMGGAPCPRYLYVWRTNHWEYGRALRLQAAY